MRRIPASLRRSAIPDNFRQFCTNYSDNIWKKVNRAADNRVGKLTGTMSAVQTFEAFGWSLQFRYFSGLLDFAGTLLVFVPP